MLTGYKKIMGHLVFDVILGKNFKGKLGTALMDTRLKRKQH